MVRARFKSAMHPNPKPARNQKGVFPVSRVQNHHIHEGDPLFVNATKPET